MADGDDAMMIHDVILFGEGSLTYNIKVTFCCLGMGADFMYAEVTVEK